jgi:hypothetical protein
MVSVNVLPQTIFIHYFGPRKGALARQEITNRYFFSDGGLIGQS